MKSEFEAFVEDVALLTPKCAIITNPGAASRKGEIDGMGKVLSNFFPNIEEIKNPGLVEAGDIMMVGSHFYIGFQFIISSQVIFGLHIYDGSHTSSGFQIGNGSHIPTGFQFISGSHLLFGF